MAEETGIIKVVAKTQDGDQGPSAEVAYDFGANLDDASKKFGPEVVFSLYRAQAKIQLQARMRTWMNADPPKDVVAMAAMWKPGMVAERGLDPLAIAKTYLANLTDAEEKAAFLEQLKASL